MLHELIYVLQVNLLGTLVRLKAFQFLCRDDRRCNLSYLKLPTKQHGYFQFLRPQWPHWLNRTTFSDHHQHHHVYIRIHLHSIQLARMLGRWKLVRKPREQRILRNRYLGFNLYQCGQKFHQICQQDLNLPLRAIPWTNHDLNLWIINSHLLQ